MSSQSKPKRSSSTLAALLEEKPKRGRPPRAVSRQNVYVALSSEQKKLISELATQLPESLSRADVPDLAISILSARFEALRQAVSDREREMPEGITDLESLYLLWDLSLPQLGNEDEPKWTSIRVSPQQTIELGRVHGTLNAVFGANRSQTFGLALVLLATFMQDKIVYDPASQTSLNELRKRIRITYE